MKINHLTICAFGPYKSKQEFDFELLNEKQLFLVTGPTGSGKTSLFDAISYALYGRSSGNGREADDFISHYAGQEEMTYVELNFSLKGVDYTIRRTPKQERLSKRGDRLITQKAEATLSYGNEMLTSISDVNQTIETILGIDASQFKQIVMLPQGEFRKLLEANSSEKEIIFRKIFKTDFYKLFQEQLRQKVKQQDASIQQAKLQLHSEVKNIEPLDFEALKNQIDQNDLNYDLIIELTQELILDLNQKVTLLKNEMNQVNQSLEAITEKINEAKGIEEKKSKKILYEEKLKEINAKQEWIHEQEQLIEKMTQAAFVEEIERILRKTEKKEDELKQSLANEKTLCERLNQQSEELKQAFSEAKHHYDQLDDLKIQLQVLQKQNEKLQEWKQLEGQVHNMELAVKAKQSKKQLIVQDVQEKKQQQSPLIAEIELLEQEIENKRYLSVELVQLENQIKATKQLIGLFEESQLIRDKHTQLSQAYLKAEKEYETQKIRYEGHRQLYLKSQAGILAETLEFNQPCPVCGSTQHPNKAKLTKEVLSEEALEAENKSVQKLAGSLQETYRKIFSLNEQFEDKIAQIKAHKQHIDVQGTSLKEHHQELEKVLINQEFALIDLQEKERNFQEDLKQLQNKKLKLKNNDQEIELIGQQVTIIEEELKVLQQDFLLHQSKMKQLYREYQLDAIDEKIVNHKINDLKDHILIRTETYQQVVEKVNINNRQLAESESVINQINEQLSELVSELEDYRQQFNLRLKNAHFNSIEEYRNLVGKLDSMEKEAKAITDYYQNKHLCEQVLNELTEELNQTITYDLTELEETKTIKIHQLNALMAQDKEWFSVLQNNQKVVNKLETIYQTFRKRILEFKNLSYLEKIANGNNDYKLTFERFVLTVYFDEIIHAANLRLKNMTLNRYVLLRDDEYSGGRGQQGLDLLVFDAYTNKKRNVKTLSGGESFMASLALALGLADVVSSHAGGVQLDTIFIDEGFGTLDPESLEHAIATLNQLKDSGRTVGIISHVQELKERVEAKIEIRKTKEGSIANLRL
jgi:DNA repair protein SbcC/Rad50